MDKFIILAFCILIVIVIAKSFNKKGNGANNPTKDANITTHPKPHIVFSEDSFEHFLDNIMKFLDTYLEYCGDNWYHLFISQEFEHIGNNTYGYLKFQILLDSWHDGMFFKHPEIEDYINSFFTFDPQETKFIYDKFRTGVTKDYKFPSEKINSMLQKYLDNYEAKHTGVKFERHSWGAQLTKNL